MLSRMLVLGCLFTSLEARAQVPPSEFDASIPDASMGVGGAETSQEMDDGMVNTVCGQNRDCERGFSCNNRKCTYVGYRMAAQQGCGGSAAAVVFFPAVIVWRLKRNRSQKSTQKRKPLRSS